MWVELQTIINEFIDLFWHYIHSLQIMKIVKFFSYFSLYWFTFGWGSGVEYPYFFFSTTNNDCVSYALQTRVYHMHAKVNFCV